VRQQRGLIVLVLVTAAVLAAGLVLVSRDDSKAAGRSPATTGLPVPAASGETSVERESQGATEAEAPAGLTYDQGARSIAVRISAPAYIAIDAETGRVLIARHDRQRRPIASLTKMMTALLVIERGHLGEDVEVRYAATRVEPNTEGLVAGSSYPRRLLLYSALMVSSNDSATALGYDVGDGSINRFYRLMNARARRLGMSDTHYRSASGLDDKSNYSSARDQALLAQTAMENRRFARIVGTWKKTVKWPPPTFEKVWVNHNLLLNSYPGTIGVKTGFTRSAGNCLAVAVRRNGHTVIAVVLGSRSIWFDMPRLVDRAFKQLKTTAA
jgi:D-alanyl-D-alanine carboxypeptidase (penicillin-binding protein 5/6)